MQNMMPPDDDPKRPADETTPPSRQEQGDGQPPRWHPLERLGQQQPQTDADEPRRRHPLERGGVSPQPSQPARPRPSAILHFPHALTGGTPLTFGLIGINVAIFLVGFLSPDLGDQLFALGSAYPPSILRNGEYHRLFTAMFLHADAMHIFFNSYTLYIIGSLSERIFGWKRFLLIYFLGGLAGSVLSVLLGNYLVPSIGASGAVFAVWGAEMLHLYQHRNIYGEQLQRRLRSLALWGGINLLFGFATPRIDNWGHIGGLLGGAALVWLSGPYFMPRRLPATPDGIAHIQLEDTMPLEKQTWTIGLYLSALLLLLIVAVLIVGV